MGQIIGPGAGIGIGQQMPPLDLEDPALSPDAVLDPNAPEEDEGPHAGYPQVAETDKKDPAGEDAGEEDAGGRV